MSEEDKATILSVTPLVSEVPTAIKEFHSLIYAVENLVRQYNEVETITPDTLGKVQLKLKEIESKYKYLADAFPVAPVKKELIADVNIDWVINKPAGTIDGTLEDLSPKESLYDYLDAEEQRHKDLGDEYNNTERLTKYLDNMERKFKFVNMLKYLDVEMIRELDGVKEALAETYVTEDEMKELKDRFNTLIDASNANAFNPSKTNNEYLKNHISQSLLYLKEVIDGLSLSISINPTIESLKQLNDLEIAVSEAIKNKEAKEVLTAVGVDVETKDKDLFTKVYEGVDSAVPTPEDTVQHKVLYLMYLYRGNIKDVNNQLFSQLNKLVAAGKPWPSLEQSLVERFALQKLLLKTPSKLDEYLNKTINLITNAQVIRGGAGAGKTDFIVKLLSQVSGKALITSASFQTIEKTTFTDGVAVKLEELKARIDSDSPEIVVIDEHSIISQAEFDINALVTSYPAIKFILLGDEQQSPAVGYSYVDIGKDKFFVNLSQIYFNGRFEMTTPILKTFRSPKLDSSDIQLGTRKVISSLFAIFQSVEGKTIEERLENLIKAFESGKFSGKDIMKSVAKMIDKVTSYRMEGGTISEGVRRMVSNDALLEEFKRTPDAIIIIPDILLSAGTGAESYQIVDDAYTNYIPKDLRDIPFSVAALLEILEPMTPEARIDYLKKNYSVDNGSLRGSEQLKDLESTSKRIPLESAFEVLKANVGTIALISNLNLFLYKRQELFKSADKPTLIYALGDETFKTESTGAKVKTVEILLQTESGVIVANVNYKTPKDHLEMVKLIEEGKVAPITEYELKQPTHKSGRAPGRKIFKNEEERVNDYNFNNQEETNREEYPMTGFEYKKWLENSGLNVASKLLVNRSGDNLFSNGVVLLYSWNNPDLQSTIDSQDIPLYQGYRSVKPMAADHNIAMVYGTLGEQQMSFANYMDAISAVETVGSLGENENPIKHQLFNFTSYS